MKLRIKGNSIRFRLLRPEVERLAAAEIVSEEVRFGPGIEEALKYSIAASDGVEELTVQFNDNQVLVLLPESTAMRWTQSGEMSLKAVVDNGTDERLDVLIEKDMVCLDRVDDPDREHAYPNPASNC